MCVEPNDSLEARDLRQGAYVVFDLHANKNGFRQPRNLRLATDDEIVAYVPRIEPTASGSKFKGDVVCLESNADMSSSHSSAMSSIEDVDVGGPAWLVRVASSSSCVGFTRFQ